MVIRKRLGYKNPTRPEKVELNQDNQYDPEEVEEFAQGLPAPRTPYLDPEEDYEDTQPFQTPRSIAENLAKQTPRKRGRPKNLPTPKTLAYETEIGRVRFNILPQMRRLRLVASSGPKRTLGTPSPTVLMKQCGIEAMTAWALVRHPETIQRLDFRTLAKLCWGLNCQPGDILVYIPAEAEKRKKTRLEDHFAAGATELRSSQV